jgi:proteasome lid subunit RPN8/RPN11
MSAPMLDISIDLWSQLVADLARTGEGRRESGAFLLGTLAPHRKILSYMLYADVAPDAQYVDYVLLLGKHMAQVWEACEQRALQVVADVHTHPAGPAQSPSDRANPIISLAGHVALILPDFAMGIVTPSDVGVHEFQGNAHWQSWFKHDAATRLILT